jgi:2-C-methyl-D-erythritol 4-phosphate cytidylyltransferase
MATRVALKAIGKRVAGVIVAAGEGRRMGTPGSKAFLPINGIPIVVYAIRPFEACSRVQSLYPVLREDDVHAWRSEILKKFPFKKMKPPVVGGSSRQESVRLGLESIREDIDIVLIHDGVRPFVGARVLERLLATMEETQAAVLAVPAKETMKIVDSSGHVLETPARKALWQIQTPQAFEYSTVLAAHHKALADGITATDDATLVERLGVPVKIVQGSYRNIKITTNEDLITAQSLLKEEE